MTNESTRATTAPDKSAAQKLYESWQHAQPGRSSIPPWDKVTPEGRAEWEARAERLARRLQPSPSTGGEPDTDRWHSLTCDGTCSPPCKDAGGEPATDSAGRAMSMQLGPTVGQALDRAMWSLQEFYQHDASALQAIAECRALLAARELDVEAERRAFEADEIAHQQARHPQEPLTVEQKAYLLRRDPQQRDSYAACGGEWEGWLRKARQATAESAPASAAPDEQQYRLLDRGDIIERGDEFLSEDAVTWAPTTAAIFIGMPYSRAVLLPARRRAAPSNSSPAGAKESK